MSTNNTQLLADAHATLVILLFSFHSINVIPWRSKNGHEGTAVVLTVFSETFLMRFLRIADNDVWKISGKTAVWGILFQPPLFCENIL